MLTSTTVLGRHAYALAQKNLSPCVPPKEAVGEEARRPCNYYGESGNWPFEIATYDQDGFAAASAFLALEIIQQQQAV